MNSIAIGGTKTEVNAITQVVHDLSWIPSSLSDFWSKSKGERKILNCQHSFHLACIKGWILIGKKDCCPYCKEKVELSEFRGNNPWDKSQQFYLNLIDILRYLAVWNPIIFLIIHYIFKIFGYK